MPGRPITRTMSDTQQLVIRHTEPRSLASSTPWIKAKIDDRMVILLNLTGLFGQAALEVGAEAA